MNFKKKYESGIINKDSKKFSRKLNAAAKSLRKKIIKRAIKDGDLRIKLKNEGIQHVDDYTGDWDMFVGVTGDFEEEFNELFKEKEKTLELAINKELEIIQEKIDNLEDYLSYLNDRDDEIDKMFEEFDGDIIREKRVPNSKARILKELNKTKDFLNGKEKYKKGFNYEFDILTHGLDGLFSKTFNVEEYFDKKKFRKTFFKYLPIVREDSKNKEDDKNYISIGWFVADSEETYNEDNAYFDDEIDEDDDDFKEYIKQKKDELKLIKKSKDSFIEIGNEKPSGTYYMNENKMSTIFEISKDMIVKNYSFNGKDEKAINEKAVMYSEIEMSDYNFQPYTLSKKI